MAVILRAARLAVLLLIAACGVDMGYMKPGAAQAQFYQELAVCEHFTEYGGFTAVGDPLGALIVHNIINNDRVRHCMLAGGWYEAPGGFEP